MVSESFDFCKLIILTMDFVVVIVSYGMLSPVDGKPKAMYLLYGDEIGRRAGHPEYMTPTSLDASHTQRFLSQFCY